MEKKKDDRKDVRRLADENHCCDWCEKDNKAASKFCQDCLTLYCDGCLASLHPLRGPFGHHRLVSAVKGSVYRRPIIEFIEYHLGRYRLKDGTAKTRNESQSSSDSERGEQRGETTTDMDQADPSVFTCEDHSVTFTHFCSTCSMTLCTGTKCSNRHNGHEILPIGKAYNRMRVPVDKKCKALAVMLVGLKEFKIHVAHLVLDIQKSLDKETCEVQAIYVKCMKAFHAKRKSELDDIEKKREDYLRKDRNLFSVVDEWVEDMDTVMVQAVELLSGDPAVFLREATALGLRIDSLFKSKDATGMGASADPPSSEAEVKAQISSILDVLDGKVPSPANISIDFSDEEDNFGDQGAYIGEKMKRLTKMLGDGKNFQKEMAISRDNFQKKISANINIEMRKYTADWDILDDLKKSEVSKVEKRWVDLTALALNFSFLVNGWEETLESAVAESAQLLAGDKTAFLNKCQKLCQRMERILKEGAAELGKAWLEFTEVRQAVIIEKTTKKPEETPSPVIMPDSLSECNLM